MTLWNLSSKIFMYSFHIVSLFVTIVSSCCKTSFKLSWDTQTVCWVNDWRNWKKHLVKMAWRTTEWISLFFLLLWQTILHNERVHTLEQRKKAEKKRMSFRRHLGFQMFIWFLKRYESKQKAAFFKVSV